MLFVIVKVGAHEKEGKKELAKKAERRRKNEQNRRFRRGKRSVRERERKRREREKEREKPDWVFCRLVTEVFLERRRGRKRIESDRTK